jgi:hypothetical protein
MGFLVTLLGDKICVRGNFMAAAVLEVVVYGKEERELSNRWIRSGCESLLGEYKLETDWSSNGAFSGRS